MNIIEMEIRSQHEETINTNLNNEISTIYLDVLNLFWMLFDKCE